MTVMRDWICSLDEETKNIYRILLRNFLENERFEYREAAWRI
jgi:hypothetical protein